jgi:hypothetical protein
MRRKFFCWRSRKETAQFTDNASHSPMIRC